MIAGRYSLEREIGRGATGAVWLGRDDVLGRQVALKQIGLLPGTDGTDLARAEREARLGAQLNHRHVVAVFDVVTDPDTQGRWLVMEYVDGVTLGQRVQAEGRIAPDVAGPLLRQAAEALVAAHAVGIAHRDVKPSNILIGLDGQVKLTDFGIARVAGDPSLTQTGLVTGSPAYLAPEVATGAPGDQASDVWSLGATAFHALAGRPPYDIGDNLLGAMYRIVHEEPPRLDDAGWMAPLLEGTMVRDPGRRWSMAQVHDFLGRGGATAPAASIAAAELPEDGTRVLPTPERQPVDEPVAAPVLTPRVAAEPETVQLRESAPARRPSRRSLLLVAAAAVLGVLVVGGLLRAVLSQDDGSGRASGSTPTGSPAPVAKKPTAAGMKAFIRDYVATVSDDPDSAWKMLTPKFQRESGGIEKYRRFWDGATDGRVLSISADPANLSVSYQVHFDHFDNGPGPTVLDLAFDHGRYRIDGEHSQGFVPAG